MWLRLSLHLLDGLRGWVGTVGAAGVVVLGDDPEVVPRHLALRLDPGQRPAHVRKVGPGSPIFMFRVLYRVGRQVEEEVL